MPRAVPMFGLENKGFWAVQTMFDLEVGCVNAALFISNGLKEEDALNLRFGGVYMLHRIV